MTIRHYQPSLFAASLVAVLLLSLGVSTESRAAPYTISGTVFEDVNYGGGAGRSKASSSGVGVQYADVELYDISGVYASGANTDANGDYSLQPRLCIARC